jgi:hypothetical protein
MALNTMTPADRRGKMWNQGPNPARQARISAVLLAILPVALTVFIVLTSPGYFRLIVVTGLGRLLIVAVIVLYALGVAGLMWVVRRVEGGAVRRTQAPLLMLVPLVVFIFPTVWIVLLGPALVLMLGR